MSCHMRHGHLTSQPRQKSREEQQYATGITSSSVVSETLLSRSIQLQVSFNEDLISGGSIMRIIMRRRLRSRSWNYKLKHVPMWPTMPTWSPISSQHIWFTVCQGLRRWIYIRFIQGIDACKSDRRYIIEKYNAVLEETRIWSKWDTEEEKELNRLWAAWLVGWIHCRFSL